VFSLVNYDEFYTVINVDGKDTTKDRCLWLKETEMNPPVDDIDTSGCDTIKACFRVPKDCTTNCDYVLTWTNAEQAVSFEMSASVSSNNHWVSFGLSHDQKMVEIFETFFTYYCYQLFYTRMFIHNMRQHMYTITPNCLCNLFCNA